MIFSFVTLFGQNESSKIDSLENKLLSEIDKVLVKKNHHDLKVFKKLKCKVDNTYAHDKLTKLIDSFKHETIRIKIGYRINEAITSYYGYDVSVISHKNKIIYYHILDADTLKNYIYYNNIEFAFLQSEYTKYYFDSLNIIMLENTNRHIYGTECGIVGSLLDERVEMETHFINRDINFFNSWISNPSYELKLYAFEAFKRLEKTGIKLSLKHKVILQNLELDNSEVMICSGCIVEKMRIRDIIKTLKIE